MEREPSQLIKPRRDGHQHQQFQGYVSGGEHHRLKEAPIMCEATFSYKLTTFYVFLCIELLVKSNQYFR